MIGNQIISKKLPYQLHNTNREFFPSCDMSNCHKYVKEARLNAVTILYFVRVRGKEASSVKLERHYMNTFGNLVQVKV